MIHIHYINDGATLRVADEEKNEAIHITAGDAPDLLNRVWRMLVQYDARNPRPLPEPPPFNPHGFAGSWEPQCPGDVGLPAPVSEPDRRAEMLDVLRSCYQVAQRKGADTNWDALRMKLRAVLELSHLQDAADARREWKPARNPTKMQNRISTDEEPPGAPRIVRCWFILKNNGKPILSSVARNEKRAWQIVLENGAKHLPGNGGLVLGAYTKKELKTLGLRAAKCEIHLPLPPP